MIRPSVAHLLQPDRAKPAKSKRPLKPLPPMERFVEATRKLEYRLPGDGWTKVVLPYPPNENNLYVPIKRGNFATKILSAEGRRYKAAVEAICLSLRLRPMAGDMTVCIAIYRPQRSGDVTRVKAVLDGLKGFAWLDDGQISDAIICRREDPSFPRAVVLYRKCSGEAMTLPRMFVMPTGGLFK